MSCDGCEETDENALRTIEGVTRAVADHEGDGVVVVVEDGVTVEDNEGAIEGAGYDLPA